MKLFRTLSSTSTDYASIRSSHRQKFPGAPKQSVYSPKTFLKDQLLHCGLEAGHLAGSFLSIPHILLIENAIQRKWPELGRFPVGIIVNQHDVAIQSVGLVVIDQLIGIIGRHLT